MENSVLGKCLTNAVINLRNLKLHKIFSMD